MTQAELARVLGTSQQSVYSIECGSRRVRIDLLPVLARTFNVTADELLGLKPLSPPTADPIPAKQLRHLRALEQLSGDDQNFVIRMTEVLALHGGR